jgi:hypothetical protein
MTEPQIWQEICGNYGDKIEEFEPIMDGYIYLVGHDNIGIVGLFIIHESEYGHQCHVQVIPERRKDMALEFGQEVIDWVWKNTDINKLIALIPKKFPNVKKFAENQGFSDIGSIDKDWFLILEK